jgi:hypothetical protein
MAPKTTAELFGLTPQERNALAILSGLEGYRGSGGKDVAAVAANVLARRLHGGYGGPNILKLATAPGQYEAIFKPGYSIQQLGDPAFGAKLFGQNEFQTLLSTVDNPTLVRQQFEAGKAPLSFRGTSAYNSRRRSDYMPVPGKSNFYFDSDPTVLKKGLSIFNRLNPTETTQVPTGTRQKVSQAIPVIPYDANDPTTQTTQNVLTQVLGGNIFGNNTVDLMKTALLTSALTEEDNNITQKFLNSYKGKVLGNLPFELNIG